jgi:hypothetical protein
MMSLQTKFLLLALLIICAPFYVLARFFYGRTFGRFMLFALLAHFIFLFGIELAELYGYIALPPGYNSGLSLMLLSAAVYVLPLHLAWWFFHALFGDARYDVDTPGRAPIPFVHPWFIDIPLAIALPVAVWYSAALGAFVPPNPDWMPLPLPRLELYPVWFDASVLIAAAYALAAVISVPAPQFKRRRKPKAIRKPDAVEPAYDVARIAQMPTLPAHTIETIMARRSPSLQKVISPPEQLQTPRLVP